MNEAALSNTWTPRRFIPLHLKLMLSYLVLAAAVLGVSLAYAWREASDENARSEAVRTGSTAVEVRQDYDSAMERALAVVNLAAATPEMTAAIVNRGQVELGPGNVESPAGNGYEATARYIAPPAEYLGELGIDPALNRPLTGAAAIDGKPAAVAISPVTSASGANGYIIVSVDLSGLPAHISGGGGGNNPAAGGGGGSGGSTSGYFVIVGRDGNLTPVAAGSPQASRSGEPRPIVDPGRLAAGNPVTAAEPGEGSSTLTYYPLPGLSPWPIMAVAIQAPVETAADTGATNPLLGLAVLATAIGLFIAHILARTMSRPVERITEATEIVAAGDISYQLPLQKGRDELAVLGESFNRMTQKYKSSQTEVEAAARRLEQTVVAQDAEIQTLFGISQAITSILDVNYLLEQVLALSMPLIGGKSGTIWLESNNTGMDVGGAANIGRGGNGESNGFHESGAAGVAGLRPAISVGGSPPAGSLAADHPGLIDMYERGWKVSVLLPESRPGEGGGSRQLFFERGTGTETAESSETPLRSEEQPIDAAERLPGGGDGTGDTQVIVPISGHKGLASGVMAMTVSGRRPLTGHEALLLFNIAGLASVAVENAGLFGLAQRRGEQIETLLRESHHRITNNLAAISGMLSAQLGRAKSLDAATVIHDNIARISSIAQVHRLLSGEMKDEVDATGMIRTICAPLVSSASADIEVNVTGPPLVLSAKKATAVALIANELVTNSIKHGFMERDSGTIDIGIAVSSDGVAIQYSDDGAGPQQGEKRMGGSHPGSQTAAAGANSGLGTQIIESLVHDELGGSWQSVPGEGYRVTIRFPLAR